jgi:hypothetical protein
MITFKLFLSEAAKSPLNVLQFKRELISLKRILQAPDLSTVQILKILNDKFRKVLFHFEETYSDHDSDYSRVGVIDASYSKLGWIIISVTHNLDKILQDINYSEFSELCAKLISRELIVRMQSLKSNSSKPLDDKDAIRTNAIQTVLELLQEFERDDILSKLKTETELNNLSSYSLNLAEYLNADSGTLKRFLSKLNAVLMDEI